MGPGREYNREYLLNCHRIFIKIITPKKIIIPKSGTPVILALWEAEARGSGI